MLRARPVAVLQGSCCACYTTSALWLSPAETGTGTFRCSQRCGSSQGPLQGEKGAGGTPKCERRGQAEPRHLGDVQCPLPQPQLTWGCQASSRGAPRAPQRCGLAVVMCRILVPRIHPALREGSAPLPAAVKGSLSSSGYSKLKYHIVFRAKMDYRLREKRVQLRNPHCKAPSPIPEALCHLAGARRVPLVPGFISLGFPS